MAVLQQLLLPVFTVVEPLEICRALRLFEKAPGPGPLGLPLGETGLGVLVEDPWWCAMRHVGGAPLLVAVLLLAGAAAAGVCDGLVMEGAAGSYVGRGKEVMFGVLEGRQVVIKRAGSSAPLPTSSRPPQAGPRSRAQLMCAVANAMSGRLSPGVEKRGWEHIASACTGLQDTESRVSDDDRSVSDAAPCPAFFSDPSLMEPGDVMGVTELSIADVRACLATTVLEPSGRSDAPAAAAREGLVLGLVAATAARRSVVQLLATCAFGIVVERLTPLHALAAASWQERCGVRCRFRVCASSTAH